jgi:hypothetical protein
MTTYLSCGPRQSNELNGPEEFRHFPKLRKAELHV